MELSPANVLLLNLLTNLTVEVHVMLLCIPLTLIAPDSR